ncbi:hypothetical protein QBC36DRAFT_309795 [Triangularia setosa]|uniref:Uncharacterized protein n=1 Tax=Triangularia setosa TaxID=2587417 RepID=A0AAN6W9C8_9PEZI|nr:hypothetical protein QBC36DRAFT_309795 [Podospora setosa]
MLIHDKSKKSTEPVVNTVITVILSTLGGYCPGYYACFNSGCILAQKLPKTFVTSSYPSDADDNKEYVYTEFVYPTSVDVFVDRLRTKDEAVFQGSVSGDPGLILGLSAHQKKRLQRQLQSDDKNGDSPYSNLELCKKADLHEVDAERHKPELSASNQNEAWELEDISYTPELWSSHRLSEMAELELDRPIKSGDVETTLTPVSPFDTSKTRQNKPPTPSPVSPADTSKPLS